MSSKPTRTKKEESQMLGAPQLEVKELDDITVLRLTAKRFDVQSFEVLTRELYRMIDKENRKKFILDLSGVEFLFSESVGLLLGLEKRVKKSGCELKLCGLRPIAKQTLETAQLLDLFEICQDEASAIASFNAGDTQTAQTKAAENG